MYHMLALNHGKRRLDCMLYKQTFSSKLRENRQLLEAVDDACDAVLNCSKLKKVSCDCLVMMMIIMVVMMMMMMLVMMMIMIMMMMVRISGVEVSTYSRLYVSIQQQQLFSTD